MLLVYTHTHTNLALATHSSVTSNVPTITLVFFGGIIIEGAMGSAGPPTSKEKQETHIGKKITNEISIVFPKLVRLAVCNGTRCKSSCKLASWTSQILNI